MLGCVEGKRASGGGTRKKKTHQLLLGDWAKEARDVLHVVKVLLWCWRRLLRADGTVHFIRGHRVCRRGLGATRVLLHKRAHIRQRHEGREQR